MTIIWLFVCAFQPETKIRESFIQSTMELVIREDPTRWAPYDVHEFNVFLPISSWMIVTFTFPVELGRGEQKYGINNRSMCCVLWEMPKVYTNNWAFTLAASFTCGTNNFKTLDCALLLKCYRVEWSVDAIATHSVHFNQMNLMRKLCLLMPWQNASLCRLYAKHAIVLMFTHFGPRKYFRFEMSWKKSKWERSFQSEYQSSWLECIWMRSLSFESHWFHGHVNCIFLQIMILIVTDL